MSDRYSNTRRGVLLLLVLAILALFGLVAVAFVLISGQSQRSAKNMQRVDQTLEDPQKLLSEAMMQVARGASNPVSVIGPHSLLEDMYGNTSRVGAVVANTLYPYFAVAGGQLIQIGVPSPIPDSIKGSLPALKLSDSPPRASASCSGTVITFLNGPRTMGHSTRIVAYIPAAGSTPDYFQIVATDAITYDNIAADLADLYDPITKIQEPLFYLINGAPFSGTGFGYNPDTGKLDLSYDTLAGGLSTSAADNPPTATSTLLPAALLPNLPMTLYYSSAWGPITNPLSNPPGGANEDYDAADYQNMLLAAQITDPTTGKVTGVLPSLHRPALVNYWINNKLGASGTWLSLWTQYPDLCRKIMMRPIGIMNNLTVSNSPDHSNFTGGNSTFEPTWNGVISSSTSYQWDVDNDGDGVPDSIWVDLGLPVRATKDGKLYKPLFAILCVDMDGRLNLNAHGNLAQANNTSTYGITTTLPSNIFFTDGIGGGIGTASNLLWAQGYSPADINLYPLLGSNYSNMLIGNGVYEGHYGSRQLPGTVANDPLTVNKWFEYGGNYADPSSADNAGSYGSPPDLQGAGSIGLDPAGRPIYANFGVWSSDLVNYVASGSTLENVPYALNLAPNITRGLPTAVNNPFSVNELERILRPFDRDAAQLPARLAALTSPSAAAPYADSTLITKRSEATTESWDVPAPAPDTAALSSTERALLTNGRATSLSDLLKAKGVSESNWGSYFPPEMLAGLKLNLNRPYGDGRDGDGNKVVDEPGEALNKLLLYATSGSQGTFSETYFDPTHTATDSLQARQLQARYLYILAMLVVDRSALKTQLNTILKKTATNDDVARYLAQWAVNAVDFRDRDSIMTPFIYDPDPLNDFGTNPTPPTWRTSLGLPTAADITNNRVVWGCKRPELLITETLAFHDRRTQDLDSDPTHKKTTDTPPDDDFDQKYKPEGSLFIELYNPWTDQEPRPYELSNAINGGVDLTKINSSGSPVWRLAIVTDSATMDNDPDDPSSATVTYARTIYFANPSSGAVLPNDKTNTNPTTKADVQFYPNSAYAAKIAPIKPGRYAVIGPGNSSNTTGGKATTYIGYLTGLYQGDASTRRIELTPNLDPDAAGQVAVYPDGASNATPADSGSSKTIQSPVAVVINSPRRLSISEPSTDYPNVDPTGIAYDAIIGNGYTTPYDSPQDKAMQQPVWDNYLKFNGTFPRYAVVHLQRLANPLLPYDATMNPYRTIDSMSVNLTTFNGITTAKPANGDEGLDASITLDQGFFTRERGTKNDTSHTNDLWLHESDSTAISDIQGSRSLSTSSTHNMTQNPIQSFGYLNVCFGTPVSTITGYEGCPASPFPWLTWNNRPYVSNMELMLVPATSSYQLLRKYALPGTGTNPYTNYLDSASNAVDPYGHLPNFFNSAELSGTAAAVELHRLLDYVGVPSRFAGTDIQGNPSTMASDNQPFYPPFNFIPTYREPGKINLNTIYNKDVLQGLLNVPAMSTSAWQYFVASRRGDPSNTTDTILVDNSGIPTEFARPFRSAGNGSLVPPVAPVLPSILNPLLPNREINATLLRAYPESTNDPLFKHQSTNAVDNTTRNPFFRYSGLERLANLATTRSNVYAVWITVGYFEVTPWSAGVDAVHPDGYQLGQEMGTDSGEIVRHRAFFMIDRTIPVGFQRGQDLNVEKAIILKRFIE
ncbi:MAG: hypothetical protein ABSA16_10810 [Thermoguttaceae bacterium]|jgi:hypothetical protein